jgi:hypothetical protein
MPEMSPDVGRHIDLQRARKILAAIERAIHRRGERLQPLLLPVQAKLSSQQRRTMSSRCLRTLGPLFRLNTKRWAADNSDLFALIPVRIRACA